METPGPSNDNKCSKGDVYEFIDSQETDKKHVTKKKPKQLKAQVVNEVLNLICKTKESLQHLREVEKDLIQEVEAGRKFGKKKSEEPNSRSCDVFSRKRPLEVSVSNVPLVDQKNSKYISKPSGSGRCAKRSLKKPANHEE
ncbi:uncharacterized protein LOC144350670 [Saccoglossus kowalevskii]